MMVPGSAVPALSPDGTAVITRAAMPATSARPSDALTAALATSTALAEVICVVGTGATGWSLPLQATSNIDTQNNSVRMGNTGPGIPRLADSFARAEPCASHTVTLVGPFTETSRTWPQ